MKKEDKIYLYDESFVGLLSSIYFLLENKIVPAKIMSEAEYIPTLFDETFKPEKDPQLSNKLKKIIVKQLGKENYRAIYFVWLSSHKLKELIIYYFILNGFKYKQRIGKMRNLNCVNEVIKIRNYVKREAHKMKGFLRFKELNNKILFAKFSSENNIMELLAFHFAQRLKKEKWLILDEKRKIICVYHHNNYQLFQDDNLKIDNLVNSLEEEKYQDLWKSFFQAIAIKERENKKCQQNFMPKKYWQNILEMKEENEKSN